MFNYMMVDQSEQFSFIRIPKMMLTDDLFSKISLQARSRRPGIYHLSSE